MDSFAAGRIISIILVGLLYAAILAIPLYLIWLLIKTLKKVARIEQVEIELKKLQEEIRSLRENMAANPPR
jgi:cytochrome c biogenesis protein CcdA